MLYTSWKTKSENVLELTMPRIFLRYEKSTIPGAVKSCLPPELLESTHSNEMANFEEGIRSAQAFPPALLQLSLAEVRKFVNKMALKNQFESRKPERQSGVSTFSYIFSLTGYHNVCQEPATRERKPIEPPDILGRRHPRSLAKSVCPSFCSTTR